MFFSSNKILKLIVSIFIFFIITYICFDYIFDFSHNLDIYIKELPVNWLSALVIILILSIDIIIPVPSSVIMVTSGALFGGLVGGILAVLGSLICSVIGFQISRKVGQEKVKEWLGDEEFNKLSNFMRKRGAYAVIFTRTVPLAMESVSCIAGLSKMKLKQFILMNVIGFLPLTFLYSFTGAIFGQDKTHNIVIVLVLGFFIPVFIWLLILKLVKFKK